MSVVDQKKDFLKAEFLTLSINGAFQHNPVYENDAEVSDAEKRALKRKIHRKLEELAANYVEQKIPQKQHVSNIAAFRAWLGSNHELKSEITFGTAQKLLNLYLKYLWCSGWIEEPPHCPIDSWIIVNALKDKGAWTTFTQEAYEKVILKIEDHREENSIAWWELNKWEELRNKK